jgi:hypothetical protein
MTSFLFYRKSWVWQMARLRDFCEDGCPQIFPAKFPTRCFAH